MLPAELDLAPVDPGFGEMYGPDVAYVTPEGIAVWMWRKGFRVRFYDARGEQVGPEHANVYPATIWAAANAWVDPSSPNLSLACIVEVRRQISERAELDADATKEVEAGCWAPAVGSVGGGDPKTRALGESVPTPPAISVVPASPANGKHR